MSSIGDRLGFGAQKLVLTPSTARRSDHLAGRNDRTIELSRKPKRHVHTKRRGNSMRTLPTLGLKATAEDTPPKK